MKKSNAAFYGGITLLIVVASFVYSWKYIIPEYKSNKAQIATLDTEIGSATKKLESLKATQKSLDQLGEFPKQLSLSVPEDKDMANLITELEGLAAKRNITLPNIGISDSGANTVSISFAIDGSFDDIHGILESLEKDIRFMNVISTTITSTETAMSMSVQLEAYKRSAVSAAAPAASLSGSPTGSTDKIIEE